jgi:hypothetical protein
VVALLMPANLRMLLALLQTWALFIAVLLVFAAYGLWQLLKSRLLWVLLLAILAAVILMWAILARASDWFCSGLAA